MRRALVLLAILTSITGRPAGAVCADYTLDTARRPLASRTVGRYPFYLAAAEDRAYVTGTGQFLVLDLSDPRSIREAGRVSLPSPGKMAVSGSRVFIAAAEYGLRVIDVSDPASPRVEGFLELDNATNVRVAGGYAYVTAGDTLSVIDISAPAAPRILGSLRLPAPPRDLAVQGGFAYVAGGAAGLQVIDLSHPEAPSLSSTLEIPDCVEVECARGYAYALDSESGLSVIDLRQPDAPVRVGDPLVLSGESHELQARGRFLYVASGGAGVMVLDLSTPSAPRIVGRGEEPGYAAALAVTGTYVLLNDLPDAIRVFPTQCGSSAQPFELLSPADGDSVRSLTPTLLWRAAAPRETAEDIRYTVFWSENPGFDVADSADTGSDTTFTLPPGLLRIQGSYSWRVVARDDRNARLGSTPAEGRRFSVGRNAECRLSTRANAGSEGIRLSWSPADCFDVVGYRVYRKSVEEPEWRLISPVLSPGAGETSFLDADAASGVDYEYQLEPLTPAGPVDRFGPIWAELPRPSRLTLGIEPNPSDGQVRVTFALPRTQDVAFRLFDVQGREVARETFDRLAAGLHQRSWDPSEASGHPLAAGTYFIRLETRSGAESARWVVLR
jgi:hypothetical protein